ncbi:GGDEF domain-containing response regulator [Leptospira fletcheri]|uniref:GGDEF domain-containing response regulator n=1 Tax=Leptospira fletcheri TaxID=2484981 RepID=A0A4R9GLL2_9LEPT|nr:response regulator [Leptospira fletcheri]TGK14036.1 GGDEF domain-containing response regulator [Leptospira fletcheri]
MKKWPQILIVEDENIVARDLKHRLMNIGYKPPIIATKGAEAVRIAKEVRPDIMIFDIMLSNSVIDGIEAAAEIRSEIDVPLIYLTAYADDYSVIRSKATEPYGYILKPFQTRELHIAIEMALYKHSMDQELKRQQSMLSSILDSIPEGLIATDLEGNVTFMNPYSEKLTGWTSLEGKGRNVRELFQLVSTVEKDISLDPISSLLSGNGSRIYFKNVILVNRQGKRKWVDCVTKTILQENKISGILFLFQSMTD